MNTALIESMTHSPLYNYAGIPGLESWLVGEAGKHGVVRMFHSTRNPHEVIIPHSHRYDFQCLVLEGTVYNTIYEQLDESVLSEEEMEKGDLFESTVLHYMGQPGKYEVRASFQSHYSSITTEYNKGDMYAMQSKEIHSIQFSKGAKVLFFEGPSTEAVSRVLRPVVGNDVLDTFITPKWAFQRV